MWTRDWLVHTPRCWLTTGSGVNKCLHLPVAVHSNIRSAQSWDLADKWQQFAGTIIFTSLCLYKSPFTILLMINILVEESERSLLRSSLLLYLSIKFCFEWIEMLFVRCYCRSSKHKQREEGRRESWSCDAGSRHHKKDVNTVNKYQLHSVSWSKVQIDKKYGIIDCLSEYFSIEPPSLGPKALYVLKC